MRTMYCLGEPGKKYSLSHQASRSNESRFRERRALGPVPLCPWSGALEGEPVRVALLANGAAVRPLVFEGLDHRDEPVPPYLPKRKGQRLRPEPGQQTWSTAGRVIAFGRKRHVSVAGYGVAVKPDSQGAEALTNYALPLEVARERARQHVVRLGKVPG